MQPWCGAQVSLFPCGDTIDLAMQSQELGAGFLEFEPGRSSLGGAGTVGVYSMPVTSPPGAQMRSLAATRVLEQLHNPVPPGPASVRSVGRSV
jgi:hypothetical protein